MKPIEVFYWEGLGMFALAACVLAWRSAPRLAGLVQGPQGRVSLVQVQLLVLTLVFAVRYLWQLGLEVAAGGRQGLPMVGTGWLAALGLSGGVYSVGRLLQQRQR